MTPVLLTNRPTTLLVPDPIEDATRREFITGVGAAALAAAFLAACGDDAEDTPEQSATRDVVDSLGRSVTIPVAPQRVIATDHAALPWLLELGVVPIASGTASVEFYGRDFNPALYDLGVDVVQPFPMGEPDIELIATLTPDLLVGFAPLVERNVSVEQVSAIAPLLVFDGTGDPFRQLREVARMLDRASRANELIAEFEAGLRGVGSRIGATSVSFVKPSSESEFALLTTGNTVAAFFAEHTGVTVVPGPEEADEYGEIRLSLERLQEVTGDAIVIVDRPGATTTMTGSPLWATLPAVQAGNVHNAGDYLTFAGFGGLAALRDQLVGVAEFVAAIE